MRNSYLSHTTIHGLNEAASSKGIFRAFWIAVTIVCFAATVIGITGVVLEFIDRPVITIFNIEARNSMEFPPVAICLEQQISRQKLRAARIHPYVLNQIRSQADQIDFDFIAVSLNTTRSSLIVDEIFTPVVS